MDEPISKGDMLTRIADRLDVMRECERAYRHLMTPDGRALTQGSADVLRSNLKRDRGTLLLIQELLAFVPAAYTITDTEACSVFKRLVKDSIGTSTANNYYRAKKYTEKENEE